MKRSSVLRLMSCLCAFLCLLCSFDFASAQDVLTRWQQGLPMSVAHRAAWKTAPENSLLAIENAINLGIDVVELDVRLLGDGTVILSHDTTINRCTVYQGDALPLADLTYEQLKAYPVQDKHGNVNAATPYILTDADADLLSTLPHYAAHAGEAIAGAHMPMARLDDALDLIAGRCMVNLDYCFQQDIFVACYTLFREAGMLEHALFKNSLTAAEMAPWYDAAAVAWNAAHPDEVLTAQDVQQSIQYVYISSTTSTLRMKEHLQLGDHLVMTEVIIPDAYTDLELQTTLEPWCRENNVKLFVNMMDPILCAFREDAPGTWEEMLARGYQLLQTDCAEELSRYLNDRAE